MNRIFPSLLALIAISFNCNVFGLDILSVKEPTCLQPEATDLNLTWAASVDLWYSPLWSKGELYHTLERMFTPEEFQNLKDEDLKKSCVYFNLKGVPVPIYAFGNQSSDFESYFNAIRPGVNDWTTRTDSNGNRDWLGSGFVVMTDNKSAVLTTSIWKDGTKGFSIVTVDKKVPEEFLTKAKSYVVDKLGFNPELFIETPYDDCPAPPALDELKWVA